MPFYKVKNMFDTLTPEKQKEAYDFICFLIHTQDENLEFASSREAYSEGFFELFGRCKDETFVEPDDFPPSELEDELF